MTIIDERIKACIDKHPDWDATRVRNSIAGSSSAQIKAIMSGTPPEAVPVPTAPSVQDAPSGGFSLRGIRLLSRKPADCMKARLYALRKGMGYKVETLAKDWGISADTIRKHAKDHRALVYVEATPGEYVACVVHPETPKGE